MTCLIRSVVTYHKYNYTIIIVAIFRYAQFLWIGIKFNPIWGKREIYAPQKYYDSDWYCIWENACLIL